MQQRTSNLNQGWQCMWHVREPLNMIQLFCFFLLQIRSEVITTYALCGFANFSSLGIVIGGLCKYLSLCCLCQDPVKVMISDIGCFLLSKPPYAQVEEVMSHLWWWELWSPGLVFLLSMLALQVSKISGSYLCISCITN